MQETESWEREVIFNRNRNSTYVNRCLHVANKFEQNKPETSVLEKLMEIRVSTQQASTDQN